MSADIEGPKRLAGRIAVDTLKDLFDFPDRPQDPWDRIALGIAMDHVEVPHGLTFDFTKGMSKLEQKNFRLPAHCTIRGNLTLIDYPLNTLPPHLIVHGDLDIRGANLTAFPAGLNVEGILDLTGNRTKGLVVPADTQIGMWMEA